MNHQLKMRALISLIIILLFAGCNRKVDAQQNAPDFTLPDLSGNMVSLKEYRGKIILLDFWATWCPPCRRSIPELAEIQKKYKDYGVVILGISMDDPFMFDNQYLLAFKEKFNINYRILRADIEVINNYLSNGRMAIPTLFIINREGKIVKKHIGFAPGEVERLLQKVL